MSDTTRIRMTVEVEINTETWLKNGGTGDAPDVACWVSELMEFSQAVSRGEVATWDIKGAQEVK